jgi:hypothetical protein
MTSNPKIWLTFTLHTEDDIVRDFIGAYESKDKALKPVREYCQKEHPDLDESGIEKLINNNARVYKDNETGDDVHSITLDPPGTHGNCTKGYFEIMQVDVQ